MRAKLFKALALVTLSTVTTAALTAQNVPLGPSTRDLLAVEIAPTNYLQAQDHSRVLSPGDTVNIRVLEDRTMDVKTTLSNSGDIDIPKIGEVAAKGKTCNQLASHLKALLENQPFSRYSVIVGLNVTSVLSRGKITLKGAVHFEGQMNLANDEALTLSTAIARAGGISAFGNRRRISIERTAGRRQQTLILPLKAGINPTDKDIVLEPNDVISIPTNMINF